jgi:predicted nucleotidyltransferase
METLKVTKKIEKMRKILKILKNEIVKTYKAEIIGIFGFYARGEQRENSDMDLLVRFLEGATLFDLVGLADFLEEKCKVKIDIVSEGAIREELKDQILKEVVAI